MTPRKALNRDNYVQAAMELVDDNGISALTMCALGEKLGVDLSAVYRHFPNKEQLIDAMLDRVLGEVIVLVHPEGTFPRVVIFNFT